MKISTLIKKLLTGACVYYAVFSMLLIVIGIILKGSISDVAISVVNTLLLFPFGLAMTGAHNPNSHGHADLGNIFVFSDGQPIFIDAGTGRYTKLTFSAARNNLWWIRSDHHNLPTINGKMQVIANGVESGEAIFDAENKTFSLDLAGAYPAEAEIETFKRTVALGDGYVTVEDRIASKIDGEIQFNYLLNTKPEFVEDGVFTVHGVRVEYDKTLAFSFDCPDVAMPETIDMPIEWETEKLYRVKLSCKLAPDAGRVFSMKISK